MKSKKAKLQESIDFLKKQVEAGMINADNDQDLSALSVATGACRATIIQGHGNKLARKLQKIEGSRKRNRVDKSKSLSKKKRKVEIDLCVL